MTDNINSAFLSIACELCDAWRILDSMGLVDTIFNHISIAVHGRNQKLYMLMNPEGLLAREFSGDKASVFPVRRYRSSEAAKLNVNPDGLILHSTIHNLRKRPGAIIHTHSVHCIAVGCTEEGLLPLCQTAMEFSGPGNVVEYAGLFRSGNLSRSLSG